MTKQTDSHLARAWLRDYVRFLRREAENGVRLSSNAKKADRIESYLEEQDRIEAQNMYEFENEFKNELNRLRNLL